MGVRVTLRAYGMDEQTTILVHVADGRASVGERKYRNAVSRILAPLIASGKSPPWLGVYAVRGKLPDSILFIHVCTRNGCSYIRVLVEEKPL